MCHWFRACVVGFKLHFTSHYPTPHHIKRFHITHHSITLTPKDFTSHHLSCHTIPHHTTSHHHCTTFHITLLYTNVPRHISVNVATYLASDHHILHLTSHYTAVCLGTTISHHISKQNMFHITATVHISHHSTSPTIPHHTHIPHHSIFHTTVTFHIALHMILHHHHI